MPYRLALPAALFLALIVAANYVTAHYGVVAIGFGLVATAGTYFAGGTFVVRDLLHDAVRASLPKPRDRDVAVRVLGVIALGAALSAIVSPALALASGVAFMLAEAVDLFAYLPLRRHGYVRAAVASNVAGSIVDTFVFLYLAGFPVVAQVVAGQIVGKVWVTAGVVVLVVAARACLAVRRTRATA